MVQCKTCALLKDYGIAYASLFLQGFISTVVTQQGCLKRYFAVFIVFDHCSLSFLLSRCKDLKDFSVSKHLMNKLMLVYVNQGNEEGMPVKCC